MFNFVRFIRRSIGGPRVGMGNKGRRNGYTLVELMVVAVITTVLLGLIIRWVLSLITATQIGSEGFATSRDVNVVSAVFNSDVTSARGCAVSGLDAPLQSYGPDSVNLYADVTGPAGIPDGIPDLVMWQLDGSRLQRAVLDGSVEGRCVFTRAPSWLTVAERVRPAVENGVTVPVFTLIKAGNELDPSYATGDCLAVNAKRCLVNGIKLHLLADSVTGSASTDLSSIADLFSSTTRIR